MYTYINTWLTFKPSKMKEKALWSIILKRVFYTSIGIGP